MGRKIINSISPAYEGKTVKDYLRNELGCSGTLLKALKREERGILLNGSHARTVDLLHCGDRLEILLPEAADQIHLPVKMALCVRYEDLLVVDKPPGMPVHRSRHHEQDTLANGVAYYLAQKGRRAPFRAVNRLDRDTSGLVLLGLNSYAAARLAHTVDKVYYAVVAGCYHGTGTIDLPIRRVSSSLILRQVGEDGQRAVTHWESVWQGDGLSLLKIRLETGRTHQIRVHFSHLGTPVLGDTLYANGDRRIRRQALHCGAMTFRQPVSGAQVAVTAPLPEDMRRLIDSF